MKIYKKSSQYVLKNIYSYVDVEKAVHKKMYTIIAGVNGVGKSSFINVFKNYDNECGHIVDPDALVKNNGYGQLQAGKEAIQDIMTCIENGYEFTQETTLSGHLTEKNIKYAKSHGYKIRMFYIGISDENESMIRIENRVKKGGHSIPNNTVRNRYKNRFSDLYRILNLCDYAEFYDNENGFRKIAYYKNGTIRQEVRQYPIWMQEFVDEYCQLS